MDRWGWVFVGYADLDARLVQNSIITRLEVKTYVGVPAYLYIPNGLIVPCGFLDCSDRWGDTYRLEGEELAAANWVRRAVGRNRLGHRQKGVEAVWEEGPARLPVSQFEEASESGEQSFLRGVQRITLHKKNHKVIQIHTQMQLITIQTQWVKKFKFKYNEKCLSLSTLVRSWFQIDWFFFVPKFLFVLIFI